VVNDNHANDRQKVVLKDVDTQNQDIVVMPDSDKMKRRQNVENVEKKDDEMNKDLRSTFNGSKLNLNGEELHDQKHETIAMEAIGDKNVDSMTINQRMVDTAIVEPEQPLKNTMNDIEANLGPVVGYAQEPMLPLAEACAPLADILHDLSFYVKMALDETPAVPPDGLTINESAAIRLYTIEWTTPHRSLYSMLNRTLKRADREDLRPYFRYMKLFLTALAKLPCVPSSTIWRGVTKNMSAEFPPGTPVTWWAFSSCTTELTVLESNMYLGNTGNRTLFSVEAINGRTVRAHSHFVTEDEILLLPGTHMIVQSLFSPAPDLHIIHLRQIVPEEVLLEPPFEGTLNIFKHLLYIKVFFYLGALLYPKIE
jgi:hypothetical protein